MVWTKCKLVSAFISKDEASSYLSYWFKEKGLVSTNQDPNRKQTRYSRRLNLEWTISGILTAWRNQQGAWGTQWLGIWGCCYQGGNSDTRAQWFPEPAGKDSSYVATEDYSMGKSREAGMEWIIHILMFSHLLAPSPANPVRPVWHGRTGISSRKE